MEREASLAQALMPAGDRSARMPGVAQPASIWKPNRIRVFITHVSARRRQVGEVAEVLEKFGLSVFVAHDAVEPTRDWQNVIEEALTTCDVLVAYVTGDFHESLWTDQEVGWAMGRGALVVPVDVGAKPYGFFGRFQAADGYPSDAWETAERIARGISLAVFGGQRAIADRLVEPMLDVVVNVFELTPNFALGRYNFDLVERVPSHLWTDDHLAQLQHAARENGQLRECGITDRGKLPVELERLVRVARADRAQQDTRPPAVGGGPGSAPEAAPRAEAFADAPVLNWQSPVVSSLDDGRIALDVLCSNEGPIGSVARVRYRAAYFHNVGSPYASGIEMGFEEFDVDTSIYSVHATINNRFLLKIRSHPLAARQLGPLEFTWLVVYTDARLRQYLTQGSLIAVMPEGRGGRLELAGRPSLDNTDAPARNRRYLQVALEQPASPVVVSST